MTASGSPDALIDPNPLITAGVSFVTIEWTSLAFFDHLTL